MRAPENIDAFRREDTYWEFLDAVKDLFAAERWQGVLMDCSKNELLALVHVYRAGETTMSRIAEYVDVPLNTATGIATRLEKRRLVERWRSEEDKRVVSVRITEQGKRQVADVIGNVGSLVGALFDGLNDEERQTLLRVLARLPELLAKGTADDRQRTGSSKGGMKRIAIE